MNKQQAAEQIKQLFQNTFNREQYIHFLRNLLNDFVVRNNHYTGNTIPDAFKQHVNQYWRIGKYTDPEGDELDLYVVEVKSLSKLDRARTALRNFAVRTMKTFGEKDHALLVYYAKEDSGSDWRFSYVKIEYTATLDKKQEKVKLEKTLTPAKRYSFLVGEHENSHTAQTQLVDLLAMDYAKPTIHEIEEAFSIEKVTKEFFEQYKDLFVRLSEVLMGQDFFQKEPDVEQKKQQVAKFAKKLLGQIVFLYFLQKKGWMGVKKDGEWGKGERHFLQKLFDDSNAAGQNYYAEKLQYLFYEALADDRKDQFDPSYYQRFECRIPFLNGGLFEAEYDWQKIRMEIPNTIFSNHKKNKSGDFGTGILDVFNRYNFTVKEDDPLDKEVAVDPEMLGKVFENMLDITERKSKGAFYTPREIVHYMCQESLIHYLNGEIGKETTTGIPKTDIETLVRKGIFAIENDQRILMKGIETDTYTFKLPETIRSHAELIDDKLAGIKICDPAIGSGAFPVGMLHEIVHARLAIMPHLPKHKRLRPYDLKKHGIAHSIYGVDIDPSAIDIARLRLWLSLVVDEDDYNSIDALPNLDYKIMQGNSLIEEYEEIKLFDEAFIQDHEDSLAKEKEELEKNRADAEKHLLKAYHNNDKTAKAYYDKELNKINNALKKIKNKEKKKIREKEALAPGLFDRISEARKKATALEHLHQEFFGTSSPARKRELRKKITRIEWELIEATLSEQKKPDAIKKLDQYKNSGKKPWFLWKLNFSEVFKQKGGFDVVLGNPPWLALIGKQMKKYKKADEEKYLSYYQAHYCFNSYMPNLYEFFLERSLQIIHKGGILCLIVPDRFGYNESNGSLRKLFLNKTTLLEIVYKWKFPNVIADTMTFICQKEIKNNYLIRIRNHAQNSDISYSINEIIKEPRNEFRCFSDTKTKALYNKINKECSPLIEYAKSTSGFGAKPKLISKKRASNLQMEILKGSSIEQWRTKDPFYFEFKIDNLSGRTRDTKKLGLKEKTLIRKTGFPLICAFDDTGRYPEQSLYFFYELNEYINNEFLLCAFNSEFFNWYYLNFLVTNLDSTPQLKNKDLNNFPCIPLNKKNKRVFKYISHYIMISDIDELYSLQTSFFKQLANALVYELYFPEEIKAADKGILQHIETLTPLTEEMNKEEKLSVIQREFERLYDPNHPVRNHLETLDSIEEVLFIRESLKR